MYQKISLSSRNIRKRWMIFLAVQLFVGILIASAFILRRHIDAYPGSDPSSGRFSGCLLHDFFHIYCPLCGGTRGIVALFQGQILTSLVSNPLSAYLVAGFLFQDIRALIRICKNRAPLIAVPSWYWWGMLAIGVTVFIVRNWLLLGFGIDPLGDLLPFYQS